MNRFKTMKGYRLMKRFLCRQFTLTLTLAALFQMNAQAEFMRGEPVPVERLITNVGALMKDTPNDAETVYTLGRLHSLAFAQGNQNVYVYPAGGAINPGKLPRLAHYGTGRDTPDATLSKRKAQALMHLQDSLALYLRAVKLAPKNGLYWFSYGWMTQQGAAFAADVNAPFLPKPAKASKAVWQVEALTAFRRAYALSEAQDLKRTHILMGGDAVISEEAGQSILDAFKGRSLTQAESAEKTQIEAHLAQMNKIPRAVTPLIFPIEGPQSLAILTETRTRVKFDLMGDQSRRVWPWVTPQTGILVWDSQHTGRIASGRQLFGSVTWWIFWKNGFDPLAALDDNHDGWLTGAELDGIAVWQDKNGNGVSDPGEVIPVQQFGIKRIAVHAESLREGALCQPQGIVMRDDSTRPLYDWTPTSLPQNVLSVSSR